MFDFPASPTSGQVFTPTGGPSYQWNGYAWVSAASKGYTLPRVQVFTASGTYTPSANLVGAIVECVGGGGGGGGSPGAARQWHTAGGGGSGGYSRKYLTSTQIGASQTVTIGTAGGGGAGAANGSAGNATSFGALCIANGGAGGGYA